MSRVFAILPFDHSFSMCFVTTPESELKCFLQSHSIELTDEEENRLLVEYSKKRIDSFRDLSDEQLYMVFGGTSTVCKVRKEERRGRRRCPCLICGHLALDVAESWPGHVRGHFENMVEETKEVSSFRHNDE